MKRAYLQATTAAAALLWASPVLSQAQPTPPQQQDAEAPGPPPPAAALETTQLQDIVVTATKRSERLQNVAVAVSAVAGEQLRNADIVSPSDLRIPNVQFVTDTSRTLLSVRGVNSAGNPGFDQAVPVYIDGIYFGRGGTARAGFLDVDRVEVLRGPQPTFLGKNAIAGALSIISRRPSDTLEGNITAFHEFEANEYNVEAGVTIPITDTLSTRFAGRYISRDGWVKNTVLDNYGPSIREGAGRASLLWKPTSDLSVYVKVEDTELHGSGTNYESFYCGTVSPATPAYVSGRDDCRKNGKTTSSFYGPAYPLINQVNGPDPSYARFNLRGAMTEVGYNLGKYTLTADVAYYRLHMYDRADVDGSDLQYALLSTIDNSHQASGELRLASPSTDRFSWLVGLYGDDIDLRESDPGGVYVAGDPRYATGPLAGTGFFLRSAAHQVERSWAVYGEAGYEILDGLKLKLAGRYSSVRKDLRNFQETSRIGYFNNATQTVTLTDTPVFTPVNISDDRTFRDFQPTATIEYRPRPGLLLWASYKEGFKAGGYDLDAFFLNPQGNIAFKPEKVKDYEGGFKFDFLNHRARLNLTLFRSDYDNLQVSIYNGVVGYYTANAATSRSQGVELEGQLNPVRGLTFSATANYLDAKYLTFPGATCYPGQSPAQGCVNGSQDLSGQVRTYSPKWSGTFGADYITAVPDVFGRSATLGGGANAFLTTRYQTYSALGPLSYQHKYVALDAHLDLTIEGRYTLSFVGRNLTNQYIYDAISPTPVANNSVFTGILRRTRQLAIQVAAKF